MATSVISPLTRLLRQFHLIRSMFDHTFHRPVHPAELTCNILNLLEPDQALFARLGSSLREQHLVLARAGLRLLAVDL